MLLTTFIRLNLFENMECDLRICPLVFGFESRSIAILGNLSTPSAPPHDPVLGKTQKCKKSPILTASAESRAT